MMTNSRTDSQSDRNAGLARKLSIVIPALNEEAGIGETLQSVTKLCSGAEIIVVDDGSTDKTADIAANFPDVIVLRQPFNRGYGTALKTGMLHSSREFVAWFDADNEHRAEDLMVMAKRLDNEAVVAVIGQRQSYNGRSIRMIGKLVIRLIARSMGVSIGPDINCGLRVFRRVTIMPYLHVLPDGFSASLTSLMIFIERGYPIAFQKINLNPRMGNSKVSLMDGFQVTILVLRTIMLVAPLRIFFSIGLISATVGASYGIGLALSTGRGLPAGSIVAVITGLLFCILGLIADQVSQMRLNQLDSIIEKSKESPYMVTKHSEE